MNRDLNRACHALDDYYHTLKEMVADGEITDEEIKQEFDYNLRELKDAVAELHRLRTSQ